MALMNTKSTFAMLPKVNSAMLAITAFEMPTVAAIAAYSFCERSISACGSFSDRKGKNSVILPLRPIKCFERAITICCGSRLRGINMFYFNSSLRFFFLSTRSKILSGDS